MSLNLISRNLIHSTPTRMALKGGTDTNNEVIAAVAKELRGFLAEYKGSHIGQEELEGFYRRHFPKANLKIIDGNLNRKTRNENSVAVSTVTYTDDMKDINEFQIYLQSKSPMDQLKWLFALPDKNKPFYVNNRFSRIFIHEYIHFMQRYLKPIDKTVHRSIQSHCPNNPETLKTIQNDIINADKNLVYTSEKGKNFTPEKFRQELMDLLYSPEYSSDMLVKDELKFLIRHTQSEKQAYEIEMEEAAWLSQPNLMKNKQYRKFRRQIARKALEKNFRFEEKLRIMKEEYFKLLKQEREKLKQN